MNRFIIIGGRSVAMLFLAITTFAASAQSASLAQNVQVTFNKTSTIVFENAITSVDRGSRDVLAQKAKGVHNVLQLKAARRNFPETNVTVITSNGQLHHFTVQYADRPNALTIVADTIAQRAFPLLYESELTEAELHNISQTIVGVDDPDVIRQTRANGILLALRGIYIRDNVMFFHLEITNQSNVGFHTSMLRFSVRDKRQAKRTATQEIGEEPIYQYGNPAVIKGNSSEDIVYAIPKFTIPDAKRLHIELKERRGGRHLMLAIKNKPIINARTIDN